MKLSYLRILSSQDPGGRRAAAVLATIHKLADDICAGVPFFLGSQLESLCMKPGLVEYPFAEARPVTLTHTQCAPLMGVWFMFAYIRNLQNPELGCSRTSVNEWSGKWTRFGHSLPAVTFSEPCAA